jgi:site-specific DNA recombinase
MTAPVRAALYARVSTDEQAERGYGLASQLTELRALAARRGYTVTVELIDDGWSGGTLDRPRLTALRELVRSRDVDVVLAHNNDRLSRDLVHQLLIIDELRRAGVKLEYCTHTVDDSAEGQFREQVLGAVAQLERAKIRERTLRGRCEKARRGLVPSGPVAFGFRRDPQGVGGYAIDPAAADVVRRIYAWCLDGTSVRQIVHRLQTQGIASPKQGGWGPATVRRILTGELYTGLTYYNRRTYAQTNSGKVGPRSRVRDRADWIAIQVPAIIARPTWNRVQAALKRHARILVGRPSTHYLLRGLCRCACGHALVGQTIHGRRLYRCAARYRIEDRDLCRAPTIGAKRLETAVWRSISATLRDPAILRVGARASVHGIEARVVDTRRQVDEARQALGRITVARERLMDLYLHDSCDKATFLARDGRLKEDEEKRKADLARLEAIQAEAAAQRSRQAAIARYCHLVASGLDRLDPTEQQGLLQRLIERIEVRDGRIEIHGILPGMSPTTPVDGVAHRAESDGARRHHRLRPGRRVSVRPRHDAGAPPRRLLHRGGGHAPQPGARLHRQRERAAARQRRH